MVHLSAAEMNQPPHCKGYLTFESRNPRSTDNDSFFFFFFFLYDGYRQMFIVFVTLSPLSQGGWLKGNMYKKRFLCII